MKKLVKNISREEILDYEKRGDCYTWCFPINLGEFDAGEIWREERTIGMHKEGITLYIHIPYCRFICSMCPFTHEVVDEKELEQYVTCLLTEIKYYAAHKICREQQVSTIYFGGGTASILKSSQVKRILDLLRTNYIIDEKCEICLECHPNTVTRDYLKELKKAGVTRVSFGIQSFQQKNLFALNLWQEEKRNKEVLQWALETGFHTVAIDLMYNFPDETMDDLQADLKMAHTLGVHGLSLYALDPEVRKMHTVRERQEKMQMEKDMFYLIREKLEQFGYLQIAQPDYALPGHANRQIIDLWGAPQKYNLGFGAGAFSESFNGCSWANIHDPKQYILCMEKGDIPVLMGRVWTEDDEIARYMALGVRMLKVVLKPFTERFGLRVDEIFKYEVQKLSELGYVELSKDALLITEKGRYYIDNISKTFFNLANRGRNQYWGCKLREYMPKRFYTWKQVCGGQIYGG